MWPSKLGGLSILHYTNHTLWHYKRMQATSCKSAAFGFPSGSACNGVVFVKKHIFDICFISYEFCKVLHNDIMVPSSSLKVWFVEGSFLGDTFTCGDRQLVSCVIFQYILCLRPDMTCYHILSPWMWAWQCAPFPLTPRIVYLQTPQGGGKTEQEARVQALTLAVIESCHQRWGK